MLDATGLQRLRSVLINPALSVDLMPFLIRALGNSKDYASIPFLLELYETRPKLGKDILRALGQMGGQKVSAALAHFLQETNDQEERAAIIDALGFVPDLPSRDVLMMELARVTFDDPLLGDILDALCETPISRHSGLISVYLHADFPEDIRVKAIWALMEATETHIADILCRLGESDSSEKVRITALAAMHFLEEHL